jgi:hypothetical protein
MLTEERPLTIYESITYLWHVWSERDQESWCGWVTQDLTEARKDPVWDSCTPEEFVAFRPVDTCRVCRSKVTALVRRRAARGVR